MLEKKFVDKLNKIIVSFKIVFEIKIAFAQF